MLDVERIQEQLRHSARQAYEAVPVPPFTAFINPESTAPYNNYAIPDGPIDGDLREALEALRELFRVRGRRARFEFIEAAAPELAAKLRDHGFEEEGRTQLMVCTAASLRAAVQTIEDMRDLLTVQRRSFGPADQAPATVDDARDFLQRYRGTQLFLARLHGEAVSGGSLLPPYNGVAEVAGIATLPAYRGRGIAGAVTAEAARTGFAQGLQQVFLTAADERAGRVYERVGFQPAGYALAYIEPDGD